MGCIYKITNTTNGKTYVGSAQNFKRRSLAHLNKLKHGKHANSHLQSSYNIHGIESFIFSILEEVDIDINLISVEQGYIDILRPEYNMCPIAGSSLGRKHSAESIEKIREASILRKDLEVTKNALAIGQGWNKGIPFTDEAKLNMSKAKDSVKKSLINIDGNQNICYFESISDAGRDGFSKTSVTRACNNGKLYKNMEWKYA